MSNESITAVSLLAQLGAGLTSSEEVVRALLDRSERAGRLNVFVHLDPERVLATARLRVSAKPVGDRNRLPVFYGANIGGTQYGAFSTLALHAGANPLIAAATDSLRTRPDGDGAAQHQPRRAGTGDRHAVLHL